MLLVTRSSLISSFNHAHVFMNKYTLFAETQINDCYYKKLREQEEKYIEAKKKCKLEGGCALEINSKDENDLVKTMFNGVSI